MINSQLNVSGIFCIIASRKLFLTIIILGDIKLNGVLSILISGLGAAVAFSIPELAYCLNLRPTALKYSNIREGYRAQSR